MPNRAKFIRWTPDEKAELTKLWNDKQNYMPTGLIAETLTKKFGRQFSLSMVLGQRKHLSLEGRKYSKEQGYAVRRLTKHRKSGRTAIKHSAECQWIDGDPRIAYKFCGVPTCGPFSSYCAHHHSKCYIPTPPRLR